MKVSLRRNYEEKFDADHSWGLRRKTAFNTITEKDPKALLLSWNSYHRHTQLTVQSAHNKTYVDDANLFIYRLSPDAKL